MSKLKFEKISDDFFVADLSHEQVDGNFKLVLKSWKKVEGKKVVIPGFEDYPFFRYKEDKMTWAIGLAEIGRVIHRGVMLKAAIEGTLRILNENKADFDTVFDYSIKRFGISPRYKLIADSGISGFSNHALSLKHCDCPLIEDDGEIVYEIISSKDEEVNNGKEVITYHCEGCDTDWAIEDADTGELLAYYDLTREKYFYKPGLFTDLIQKEAL